MCLGELEELQETSIQVKASDSANKSSNKGPVNGFKWVATLHPESEKQDNTKETQSNQQIDWQNQSNNHQKQSSSDQDQQRQVLDEPGMLSASVGTANQTTTGQYTLGWQYAQSAKIPTNKGKQRQLDKPRTSNKPTKTTI